MQSGTDCPDIHKLDKGSGGLNNRVKSEASQFWDDWSRDIGGRAKAERVDIRM